MNDPEKLEKKLKKLLEKTRKIKVDMKKTYFYNISDIKYNLKIMEEISENIYEMHSYIGA